MKDPEVKMSHDMSVFGHIASLRDADKILTQAI